MAHAVVRTDLMSGTDVRSDLVSVRYMGDGETATDIDNGNVVKIELLMDGERELFKGVTPSASDAFENIVLIATPEVMYDARKKNLDEFYNESDGDCRGYRLHESDVFSVTKEALTGAEVPKAGDIVELTDDTKLNIVTEASGSATVIGRIMDVENTGRYTYYVILVEPSPTAASTPAGPVESSKIKTMDSGTIEGFDKSVSDLISDDTKIAEDGSVTGTLHYVENWTKFSSDPEESSGNFFPIKLDDQYKSQNITCTAKNTKTAMDTEWIVRIADNGTTVNFKIEGGADIITLNFNGATLEKKGGGA